ncbi:MAG: PTS sugar transporter subunit IIA [Micrococcales bacterium]
MSQLIDAFGVGSIALGVEASDWREAIAASGTGLVASGCATADYTSAMIQAVVELGPYIVIAPGLAVAHARPGAAVLKTGMSLAVLANPVAFGNQANDPVSVVFGLSALDHDKHLELLSAFANRASSPGFVNLLLSCRTEAEIRALLF